MMIFRNPSERQEQVLSQIGKLRYSHESGMVPPSWVVVSSCTTLESAASEKLQALVAGRVDAAGADKLITKVLQEQIKQMDGSWHERLKWLAHGFGAELKQEDRDDLLAMVYLRNAIAHHGDRFTSRQINQHDDFLATRNRLEARFALHAMGIRFFVTNDTADAALGVARRVTIGLLD